MISTLGLKVKGWMTEPKRAENEINAILGIEDKEFAACIPIGYPDREGLMATIPRFGIEPIS